MKKLFVFSFFVLSSVSISAQTIISSGYNGKNQQFIKKEPGHFYYTLQTRDDSIKIYDSDLLETENVIVEFTTPPLFKVNKNKLSKIPVADYRNLFDKFTHDLSALLNNMTKKTTLLKSAPVIKKEFYKLFTGVNIEVPKGLLASISSLLYVKRIFKNNRVYPLENDVLSKYDYSIKSGNFSNLKGDSIVVGEIDTGIDYMNLELGGGFGPGYKVIGGYDIINEDADPMDDIGHGTHVAGIIAADGDSLVGVAPHAKLMAFKVFSPEKPTFDSDIITAVERAVDPNNDGSIDDKVNVVNMSLGGNGNPEDPVTIAVDNASELGIVFCVAVGNSADFFTISSPGNARSVIGVGASDYDNNIAYFSSKGPTRKTYLIKPDVLAPGVNVLSTYLNNTFVKMSGTSMATPYVAGVCALLKQIHKNWSSEKIKSAIMLTATSISKDVMEQGAGIVNPAKALDEQTTITPSSLSYGFCNLQEDVWTKTDTLLLKNNSDSSRDYSINISDPLLQVSPSNLSVGPNDSAYIYVTLTVDNNKVNFLQSGSFSYNGNLNISDGTEQLHIPWAFVKAPKIFISFDKPVMDFIITDQNNTYFSYKADWDDDYTHAELLLPSSTYDITSFFILFDSDSLYTTQNIKIVNNENVTVENGTNIYINSADAKNQVYFEGTDDAGEELIKKTNWSGGFFLLYPDYTRMKSASFSIDSGTVISFSNISRDFSLLFGEFEKDFNAGKVYVCQHDLVKGVNSDIHLSDDSDNSYIAANLDIYLCPFRDSHRLCFGNTEWIEDFGYGSSFTDPVKLNTSHWNGTLYISKNKSNLYGFSTNIFEPLTDDNHTRYSWFGTDIFKVTNSSIGFIPHPDSADTRYMVHDGGKITIGNGIPFPNPNIFYQYQSSDFIYLTNPGFQGQFGEYRYSDLVNTTYKLFNGNDNIIRQGKFFGDSGINFNELSAGNYKLEMKNSNYTIGKERGTLSMDFYFDKTGQFAIPQMITSLQIVDSNRTPVSIIPKNEKATVLFSINYISELDTVRLLVKEQNDNEWKSLNCKYYSYSSYYGYNYTADLSNYTGFDSTALDLKLEVINEIKGRSEITWEPAVGIGKFEGSLKPLSVDIVENKLPAEYKLYNNYPNPFNSTTNIEYNLPYDSRVKLEIFNIIGQRLEILKDGSQSAGTYHLSWNADRYSSGVYLLKITAEGKTFFSKTKKMILLK